VGSPEGRTPNVDAKFLTTFFFFYKFSPISSQGSNHSSLPSSTSSLLLFLLPARSRKRKQLNSSPLQPPGDQQYGVSGNAPKKFFGQISPWAQRFARGRMPE
jgi:hypothetical protein